MHAVVNTNTGVSGLLSPCRPPALVLAAIAGRQIKPVVCADVVAEYWRVLSRPGPCLPAGDVRKAVALIHSFADGVVVPPYNGTPVLPTRLTGPLSPAHWRRDAR